MKKKWILIGAVTIAAVLFIVFGMVIPAVNSNKEAETERIDRMVHDIFEYPAWVDEDDITRLQGELKEVQAEAWKEAEFKKKSIEAIENHDWDVTYLFMDFFYIKEQQRVLEALDYKLPEFEDTYRKTLLETFDRLDAVAGFTELADAVLEGPIGEAEKYGAQLSYYTDPQTIFVNEFLPGYFEKLESEAVATRDTAKLVNLCAGLGAVSTYTDVSALADVKGILNALTTGAEEITVKEGEGFYGDKSNAADSDYRNDEVWDTYLPGDYIHSKFKSVKYYGDLASYYSESGGVYRDEDGKVHGDTATVNSSSEVHLKGERISWDGIKQAYIKHAWEEGMVSYHKDGFCFAISDTAMVCFVGQNFYYVFAE